MEAALWQPGDIVLQEGYNAATRKLIEVRPATVVEDSSRALVLYFAAGSTYLSGDFMHGSRRYERSIEERVQVYLDPSPLAMDERVNAGRHVLSIVPPDAMHATWFFWDFDWNVTHVFVNLQDPYRRRARSIEIVDVYLDIAATPDLLWRWKDVDEFEALCAHGVFSPERRESIWAEARRLGDQIDRRDWPFDGSWDAWRPPYHWAIPQIRQTRGPTSS
ncbi:MAG: YgaC family protein [Dehalococcoidia bacterium]|nr:YgaC family protein [Dehalococcoidia bacterium]